MRGETAKRGSRQKPGRQEGDPGQLTEMTNLGQHIKGQDKDKGQRTFAVCQFGSKQPLYVGGKAGEDALVQICTGYAAESF